jgi:hypothetical protein
MPFSEAALEKLRRLTTSQKTRSDLRCMADISHCNIANAENEPQASYNIRWIAPRQSPCAKKASSRREKGAGSGN